MFLLEGSYGPLNLSTGVGLSPGLITDVLDPLLGHKNLLSNLHKNNEGIPCIKKKRKNESATCHLIQRFVG